MYRSWAYILMIIATLVGVVALLWPSPTVLTVAEVASPPREAAPARPEASAKPAKAAAKAGAAAAKSAPAAKSTAKPVPAPVVSHMPTASTLAKRAVPQLQNGMGPNMFGKPAGEGPKPSVVSTPPGAKPGITARPTPEAPK